MEITRDTRLSDVLREYPWLLEEAVKLDSRFRMLDSPLGRLLMRRATVAELSRRTGIAEDVLVSRIRELIIRGSARRRNGQP